MSVEQYIVIEERKTSFGAIRWHIRLAIGNEHVPLGHRHWSLATAEHAKAKYVAALTALVSAAAQEGATA